MSTTSSLEDFRRQHGRSISRLAELGKAESWGLAATDFAAALHRSLAGRFSNASEPSAAEVESFLDSLAIEDLALAAACERGADKAWIEFLGRFRPILFGAALGLARDEARAREITDELYADLYGLEQRDGRRRSLFRYFHGRSSLATWLRSVVTRTFVDGYRANRRGEALKARVAAELGSEAAIAVAPMTADPDRVRSLEMLRQALAQALGGLEPRDRLRMSYHYAQGLTMAEVGRLVGEHESTVSRKLERARQTVRREVEQRLESEHGLDKDEVRACYAAALESWPFDLTKSLATP